MNDPTSRVLGWRGVDFVAATAVFQRLAATLALLLTMSVPCPVKNVGYHDPFQFFG